MCEFDLVIKNVPFIQDLNGTTIMITGSTGTIGKYIVSLLLHYNANYNGNIKIVCPVRDIQKAVGALKVTENPVYLEYNLNSDFSFDFDVDYIIHCAGPTRSSEMVQRPVDTIDAIFGGTKKLLEFFRNRGRKSFLYISSVEVYGENYDVNKVLTEDDMGSVNPLKIRSSYPEAKRLAETLCMSYVAQFDKSVKIARLSQILGVGTGDNRLIGYLCDCAKSKEKIVLKSDGKATKAYCYLGDCVSALLYILIKGDNTAYNVANDNMVKSVRELAEFIAKRYGCGEVVVENKQTDIYPKSSYLVMNTDKLRALGWRPLFDLEASFDILVNS